MSIKADIRKMLSGLSSEQVGRQFGFAMRWAFDRGRDGNPPGDNFCYSGLLREAAKEGYAQYMRAYRFTNRVNMIMEA